MSIVIIGEMSRLVQGVCVDFLRRGRLEVQGYHQLVADSLKTLDLFFYYSLSFSLSLSYVIIREVSRIIQDFCLDFLFLLLSLSLSLRPMSMSL